MATFLTLSFAGFLVLSFLGNAVSFDKQSLPASFAKETTLSVVICDRFKNTAADGTEVYSIVFDAANGEKLLNNGDLEVPKAVYARAHRSQKRMLTVDKDGKFKSLKPAEVPAFVA